MSLSFTLFAVLAVVCSGTATVTAALDHGVLASIFAGTATVLFGLEKTLRFREQWAHHTAMQSELEALRVRFVHGGLPEDEAIEGLSELLKLHARSLPFGDSLSE